jgi:hypothetical protein
VNEVERERPDTLIDSVHDAGQFVALTSDNDPELGRAA